ncbi:MAG TPA: pyruvate, phosphate dikinase [Actinomycetes bacterium]
MTATRYIYDFEDGNRGMADLLGGKGANLAEMTRLGLPVPHGFIVTTEACNVYLKAGNEPPELAEEMTLHLRDLEQRMSRRLGDPHDPLLVSVRSGARFSMPGMMDTVLNIGLTDESVGGLAEMAGDERFAWDSYRRLVQMFGRTVLGIDGSLFEEALDHAKKEHGASGDLDLDAAALRDLTHTFQQITERAVGRPFPQDPREQLDLAVRAVFDSWNGERARIYRRQERIPHDLGTAVSIVAMVFGNLGSDSGTGVCFTRDPSTGSAGVYGDYLANAQGEDVVAGIRNTLPLTALGELDPEAYRGLLDAMAKLEGHYRDLCDIEFTVERGKLWILQTRVGKRTAAAAFRIAVHLLDEGVLTEDEALERVHGAQLTHLMFPRFDTGAAGQPFTVAVGAAPGAAVGKVVFDSHRAQEWAARGEPVVLVRRETNPDDLGGMIAAVGILTSRGGKTSHAAVVARGMGRTCVVGAEQLQVDVEARQLVGPGGVVVAEGDVVSIDGTSGQVFLGEVAVVPSPVVEYFEGRLTTEQDDDDVVSAVERIMRIADARRRLGVRANADTGDDAARARRFGAQGVGLARTEHMFLGDRRSLVEDLILAPTAAGQQHSLDALVPLQKSDFIEILSAMDGLPVTIRLIDPPLHEFLPDLTDLSVEVAVGEEQGKDMARRHKLLDAVRRLHEANPMLGLRGVRLGLVIPGLFGMQVRAIAEAAAQLRAAGHDPRPQVMIPLVGAVQEFDLVRARADEVIAEVAAASGAELTIPIGTMIELPRAALTAGRIAEHAEFFSFGTNDLTQTTWGFSRDDVEGEFFTQYLEYGVFQVSPFESIDAEGVGRLVRMATTEGRAAREDLDVGVCGEHGGDPDSVHFFHEVGLDYVSCSPFRVPVARLEAGRAAVTGKGPDTTA